MAKMFFSGVFFFSASRATGTSQTAHPNVKSLGIGIPPALGAEKLVTKTQKKKPPDPFSHATCKWPKWPKRPKRCPKMPKILKIAKNGPKLPKIAVFDLRLVPGGHGHQLWPIVTKKNPDLLFWPQKTLFLVHFGTHAEMTKNGQKTPKIVQKPKIFKLFQMVPNGPQWPPNGLKWPQNAFLGDLSPFWGDFGRFPPHFGGSPPGVGRTLRSPGSGWEAPLWNPYLSCVAIAKIWRLGAGSLSGQLVAPMDSTSSGR